MARTGRPPKPTEQKRVTGNPGKRKLPPKGDVVLVQPGTLAGAPKPMRALGKAGTELWDRAWRFGFRWLAETDAEMLMLVCEQMDERQVLRLRVLQRNDWRERNGLRQLDAAIASNLAALGFTPEARTRLALGEVQVHDALAAFRLQAAKLAAAQTA